MWMVRAGRGGDRVDDFIQQGVAGFLEDRLPDVGNVKGKDELLALYAEHYPKEKEGSRGAWASQLLRWVKEVKVGDPVVVGDPERRRYVLGNVSSEYVMLDLAGSRLHARRVQWAHEVARDALSTETKNTLGAIQTIFKIRQEAAKDLQAHAQALGAAVPERPAPTRKDAEQDQEELSEIGEETFQRANEFIEDQIDRLSPAQMQELVAGLLRAMGYRTSVAEAGPDRGVDVFASPDGLGLQDPRIFVEVKHRTAATGAPQIRSFLGGRRKGDRCLYVSTGGFSRDAMYEADRAEVALNLITLPKLRQLIVDFYDKLDSETRALVPLRRFYWPITNVAR
jgi:restriction system protein